MNWEKSEKWNLFWEKQPFIKAPIGLMPPSNTVKRISSALNFSLKKNCLSPRLKQVFPESTHPLLSCREFGHHDDANVWRKSTKEADKDKILYCNLESKNLSMHLRHHHTNSCQCTSERPRCSQSQAWAGHSSSELCCLAFIIIPCIVCNLLLTFLSSKCSTIASMMCSSVLSFLLWMHYYMNLLQKV